MNTSNQPIKIGIVGYGNLGKGVELAIRQNTDLELVAVFTRRDPQSIPTQAQAIHIDQITEYRDIIDVMIICGGSSTDLPEQVPYIAQWFNTVDSFDTHAKIPEFFNTVNKAAKDHNKLSLISTGWDPGLFSMLRLLGESILPQGETYTFWGKGLSQGHSDAIRRISGVKGGVQYTIPIESALDRVRQGENPVLTTAEKHERICYVVAEDGADTSIIEHTIKTMPNYFADYNTTVHFISEEELKANHSAMPHGGKVFRSGITGTDTKQNIEFGLTLESNPEFTASVLVAFSRAVYKLAQKGETGAMTVYDIPLGALSPKSAEDLRREIL
ncbi:diaminopimelate dehydrogenase [Myroides odoratimimus]|uniref:Meso-diaminopimelate D-dehydrogenase n=2 Tax=Myroides odoratimimus TaxID=76832 RepID=A0ABP2N9N1_9FLAO|nr:MULTISPECIES: diaminopimelate dehydrogenase [Myroides]EHO08456.1 diaminopimelate dehydrogenase [Myroides odoratimimus CCUG 10230]EHO12654.1 diaminopimelate dehydrogenase [Myroides odoratimimus CIP 101113]MDM1414662.1 diaminopimelate dehydrogenase [Myroides odoratimimus]MDM1442963.1 diaminopimelate dehydrogenase [Myroides odoratimimus]MDM1446612.1 diaminopimelate dehydrogenase [Myroides odoratimimus]